MTTENTNDSNLLEIDAANNIEPILVGSTNDDELTGDSGRNVITDNDLLDNTIEDNDRLNGGDGDDLIVASGGDDILIGGTGNDSMFGGNGNDVAIFAGDESEYEIGTNALGLTTVTNISDRGQGTDLLAGIETIQFDNDNTELETPIDETPVDEKTPTEENPTDEVLGEETPDEETPDETPVLEGDDSIEISVSSPSSIVADGTNVVTVT